MSALELKFKRLRSGIKQFQLAQEIGISASRLSQIESGRRAPSTEEVKAIRRALSRRNVKKAV